MKKILISAFILVGLLLAWWFTSKDLQNLEYISCFGFGNSSLTYDEYKNRIKNNEKIILEPYNQNYFNNFEQLRKYLYYDIYLYNGLKIFIKVSNPKYEKMYQVTLRDRNDESFIVPFSETKKIESYVRVDDFRKRDLMGIPDLDQEILLAPSSILNIEYNPQNGVACFIAEPKGNIKFPIFINRFLSFLKYAWK